MAEVQGRSGMPLAGKPPFIDNSERKSHQSPLTHKRRSR